MTDEGTAKIKARTALRKTLLGVIGEGPTASTATATERMRAALALAVLDKAEGEMDDPVGDRTIRRIEEIINPLPNK